MVLLSKKESDMKNETLESGTELQITDQFAIVRSPSRDPAGLAQPLLNSIMKQEDIDASLAYLVDLQTKEEYKGQLVVFYQSNGIPWVALYDNTGQLVFVNIHKQFTRNAAQILEILTESAYDLSADEIGVLHETITGSQEKIKIYTKRHILWSLIKLSVPITLVRSIATFSTFWTAALLRKLGPDVLAASAYITTTMLLMVIGVNAPLNSVSTVVSNRLGSGDKIAIGRAFQQGLFFSLILAVIVTIPLIFITNLLEAFGQKQPYVSIAGEFFNGFVCGAPATSLLLACQGLGYGMRRKKLVIVSGLLGLGSLLFFGYGLSEGMFGMTKYGVIGLGYATAIQYWVSLISLVLGYAISNDFKDCHLFKFSASNRKEHWDMFKELLLLGWPTGVSAAGDLSSNSFRTMMVGWIGGISLAAKQVTAQYLSIIVTPMFATALSSNILVGAARGAGNLKNAKHSGDIGVLLGSSIAAVFLIMMAAVPDLFISAFVDTNNSDNKALVKLLEILLILLGVQQISDTVRHICLANMRSLYHVIAPMLVSLVSIWGVGCGFGYCLAFPLKNGIKGLFYGEITGMTIAAVGLGIMWKHYLNKELALKQIASTSDPFVESIGCFQNLRSKLKLFTSRTETTTADPFSYKSMRNK